MNVLLDTCALIWAVGEPDQLAQREREVLEDETVAVYVSIISAAEVACLSEQGKVAFDRHWKLWFNHFVKLNAWRCLDITLDIVQEAYSLPGEFHKDPADRLIVATAREQGLTIATGDRRIIAYPHVETIR